MDLDDISFWIQELKENKLVMIFTILIVLILIVFGIVSANHIDLFRWYKVHYLIIFEITAGLAGILVLVGWIVYFWKKSTGEITD